MRKVSRNAHSYRPSCLCSQMRYINIYAVEGTFGLPPEMIIDKAMTKVILRESMKGVLPEKTRNRQDKIGFATPWESWFRTEKFQSIISGLINSRRFKERGYLDPKKCSKAFNLHIEGKVDIAKEIWKWVNLELWFKKFVD